MTNSKRLMELLDVAAKRQLDSQELDEFNHLNSAGGFDAVIGIRYTLVSNGEVRAMVHIGPQHHQPWGVANGGVYCSLAESVASLAGVIAAGGPVVGINNDTNFIRSLSAGVLEAQATPLQLGRRTQVWEVTMTHNQQLVSKTTLRTMVLDS